MDTLRMPGNAAFALRPVLVLPALAAGAALLGAFVRGPSFIGPGTSGLYMILTGVWFALVIAYAIWQWGRQSWLATAFAFVLTWIGWEAAVNLAIHLDTDRSRYLLPEAWASYAVGFAAGALGAALTWAGAAAFIPRLRQPLLLLRLTLVGAVLGLLLPLVNYTDNAVILLLPWEVAVAYLLATALAPESRA